MKIEKKQLPKTTPIYCQACLKAQKLAEDDREIEQIRQLDEQYARDETCRKEKAFFEFLGVPSINTMTVFHGFLLATRF